MNGSSYEAEEILVIDSSIPVYEFFNLTIDTSSEPISNQPNSPINPKPTDGATGINTNPTLSVDVTDPDGDSMDVTFYNAGSDSVIGIDSGVSNGSTASITWSGRSNSKTYSWYAIANDGSLDSPKSKTWSFTTKSASSPGDDDDDDDVPGGGGGVSGGDTGGPSGNIKPTAAATVDKTTGTPGTTFNFDASDSEDTDGSIETYTWDFDDGTREYNGVTISHTFSSAGTYDVMLTVEDSGGLTDDLNDPIVIEIVAGNNPPTDLTISPSETMTSKNTDVEFTISATDVDENDTITYTIDWDDMETMTSDPYNSTESFSATHQWDSYGAVSYTHLRAHET